MNNGEILYSVSMLTAVTYNFLTHTHIYMNPMLPRVQMKPYLHTVLESGYHVCQMI